MPNTVKYFVLLESLQFNVETVHKKGQQIQASLNVEEEPVQLLLNLQLLRKCVKFELCEIIDKLCTDLALPNVKTRFDINSKDDKTLYIINLMYVIHELIQNINFDSNAKEDLISTRHLNLCISAAKELDLYAMRQQLHENISSSDVFKTAEKVHQHDYALLQLSIEFFGRVLNIHHFYITNSMELVLRDFMAAIFSLKLASIESKYLLLEIDQSKLKAHLNNIWLHLSKTDFMRNILLLKAMPFPKTIQMELHRELCSKLGSKDGFASFVSILLLAQNTTSDQRTNDAVSNIVAHSKHSQRFQHKMVKQIFEYCRLSLNHETTLECMGVGLHALRSLYDLSDVNKLDIAEMLIIQLKPLILPDDILSGLIILDHQEISARIKLLHELFCTSTVNCLPSILLVDYIPLLLQLYDSLPESLVERSQICGLITRCLDNRESQKELPEIIKRLYTNDYAPSWKVLNSRLIIMPMDETLTKIVLKVAPANYRPEYNMSIILPTLQMNSSHHTLTYKIFIILLRLMSEELATHTVEPALFDLISEETDYVKLINCKYATKIEILLSLDHLIAHQPLKTQIAEHGKDFFKLLSELLQQRLEKNAKTQSFNEAADQTLLILLTLLHELIIQYELGEVASDLMAQLKQLSEQTANQLVQQQIKILFASLSGQTCPMTHRIITFDTARALIEAKESHLQVYGIEILLQLMRDKDEATIAQAHAIIALALVTLKNKESYTYLNCVRVFVALINFMEAEVLEVLGDEYLSEMYDIDYRLVVGEAILKVARELGPLCYKYKSSLINCFVTGARSPTDEFRMSAYANLAQICRILTYQVHNVFQDLVLLIDGELSLGKYLPAKRAAVLVLSEMLEGIDNLADFDEMLLPIYRLLQAIEAAENCDAKMRQHAANGLKALNEKCHKFFAPEQHLHKEINVLGIKDKSCGKSKPHILEIN